MVYKAESLDWNVNAGRRLDELAHALPPQPRLDLFSVRTSTFIAPRSLNVSLKDSSRSTAGAKGRPSYTFKFVMRAVSALLLTGATEPSRPLETGIYSGLYIRSTFSPANCSGLNRRTWTRFDLLSRKPDVRRKKNFAGTFERPSISTAQSLTRRVRRAICSSTRICFGRRFGTRTSTSGLR